MAFEIIKAETRVSNMITWFAGIQKKITDFIVGGKTRTKFEAIAVELEAQDLQFYIAAKKAIATGIYQGFNFNLIASVRASGTITFTAATAPTNNITIPAGTKVATVATSVTPEKVYQTTADCILQSGQTTVSVPITAVTAGTTGNTGVGTITVMKTTISGISTVNNASALTNGAEKETEGARRIRFQAYIATLTRGTNDALIYGAKTATITDGNGDITERVTSASVIGPPSSGSAGSCDVYIFNGVAGASTNLISKAQTMIDGDAANNIAGYKAAGVVVTVHAATAVTTNVTMAITALSGYDTATIQAAALAAIDSYLSAFEIGTDFIFNELVERIMNISGVYNVSITAPTGDVTASDSQVIIPGTISVTVS